MTTERNTDETLHPRRPRGLQETGRREGGQRRGDPQRAHGEGNRSPRVAGRWRQRGRLREGMAEAPRRRAPPPCGGCRPQAPRAAASSRPEPHLGGEAMTARTISGAERHENLQSFEDTFAGLEGVADEHVTALRRASTTTTSRSPYPQSDDPLSQAAYTAAALRGLAEAVAALQGAA